MIAGHIDALTARLKPVSTKPNSHGYVQLGVAPYAGGLNATWWDRDLSIGGKVIVRDEETGKTTVKLVKLGWPSKCSLCTMRFIRANCCPSCSHSDACAALRYRHDGPQQQGNGGRSHYRSR